MTRHAKRSSMMTNVGKIRPVDIRRGGWVGGLPAPLGVALRRRGGRMGRGRGGDGAHEKGQHTSGKPVGNLS